VEGAGGEAGLSHKFVAGYKAELYERENVGMATMRRNGSSVNVDAVAAYAPVT
jgi:hypothetical protein